MQALKKYTEECNDEGSLIDNKITVKVDGKEYGLSGSGTIECDTCGSHVFYERELSVSYNSSVARANKNIKEIS